MLELLGLQTEIVAWLASAVAIFVTIYFWNRLSQNNWKQILSRFIAIMAIQGLVIIALGITINRSNDFYDSWGDLFGAKNQLAKLAVTTAELSTINSSDIAQATRTPNGSLIFKKIIKGEKSGISDWVYLVASPILARQLESPTHSLDGNYQVIELFSGTPGVPQTWIQRLDVVSATETLEGVNQIIPTLFVIPSINVVAGLDTECMNFEGGAQVETWITDDMRTFVQKFIGIDDRRWGAFGFSTGGWCASVAALYHQDEYFGAVAIASYFQPKFSISLSKREKNYLSTKYDLVTRISEPSSTAKLLIIASVQDKFANYSANKFLFQTGYNPRIKYISESKGGHNISVWKPFVPTGLIWLTSINATQ